MTLRRVSDQTKKAGMIVLVNTMFITYGLHDRHDNFPIL